jgi:tyrosyl-tRNA synthetase
MHGEKVYGLVWPLVERSDGKKFSKSGGEAVWLASDETSPYAYYQWFLNVPDADVGRFLKLYTFLSMGEIAELEEATAADPAGRPAQRALAAEATRIMHGDDGLAEAQRASDALFGDEPFADLDERTLADAFVAAPSTEMPPERLTQGIGLLELMVAAGAAASNGEARRLVEQGGVRLNNNVADDPAHTVGRTDLIGDGTVVLRVGKKRYFLVRFR